MGTAGSFQEVIYYKGVLVPSFLFLFLKLSLLDYFFKLWFCFLVIFTQGIQSHNCTVPTSVCAKFKGKQTTKNAHILRAKYVCVLEGTG